MNARGDKAGSDETSEARQAAKITPAQDSGAARRKLAGRRPTLEGLGPIPEARPAW